MRKASPILALVVSLLCAALWSPVLADDPLQNAQADNRQWLPNVVRNYHSLAVNTQNRRESREFYEDFYLPTEDVPPGWTGDSRTCEPGATSEAFRAAMRLRINYFRAMAGVPADIVLSHDYNRKAQQAALMMSANRALDHSPPEDWTCYTADGAQAAGRSNLYLGVFGSDAVSGYIEDPGDGNFAVGHRRWVLCPQSQVMGTGDIPRRDGQDAAPANALWVIDLNHIWDPRPPTRDGFVAWPPPGYVPSPLVFPRWSFSYDDADFTQARVGMTSAGVDVPLTVEPVVDGYCENTLVWRPAVNWSSLDPSQDRAYAVTVRDVLLAGQRRIFTYTVTVFAPN